MVVLEELHRPRGDAAHQAYLGEVAAFGNSLGHHGDLSPAVLVGLARFAQPGRRAKQEIGPFVAPPRDHVLQQIIDFLGCPRAAACRMKPPCFRVVLKPGIREPIEFRELATPSEDRAHRRGCEHRFRKRRPQLGENRFERRLDRPPPRSADRLGDSQQPDGRSPPQGREQRQMMAYDAIEIASRNR
jgi:hypothetical protein